jgi:hypothetical protein
MSKLQRYANHRAYQIGASTEYAEQAFREGMFSYHATLSETADTEAAVESFEQTVDCFCQIQG